MPDSTDFAIDEALRGSSNQRGGFSCRGCNAVLPIRLAGEGESPGLWECTTCRARYPGILLADQVASQPVGLWLASVHFDTSQTPPIPSVLRHLARQFMKSTPQFKGVERRTALRQMRQQDIKAIPLDAGFSPGGYCFWGIVHNVSTTGLGIVSTIPVDHPNIAIQLPLSAGGHFQLFGRVTRCKQLIGRFHEVGMHFQFRLGSSGDR